MSGEIGSWTVERDGITYRVDLDPDYEANARPADQGETYSPADIRAHTDGAWQFVGVTVSPVISGIDAETADVTLWGVEFGTMPAETEEHLGGMHAEVQIGRASIDLYPVPDLVSEVRGRLRDIRTALQALPLDDCPVTHLRTEGIPQPVMVHCERAAGHGGSPHRVMDYQWMGRAVR